MKKLIFILLSVITLSSCTESNVKITDETTELPNKVVKSLDDTRNSYLYPEDLFDTYQEIKMEAVRYKIKEILEYINRVKGKRFYTDIVIY